MVLPDKLIELSICKVKKMRTHYEVPARGREDQGRRIVCALSEERGRSKVMSSKNGGGVLSNRTSCLKNGGGVKNSALTGGGVP